MLKKLILTTIALLFGATVYASNTTTSSGEWWNQPYPTSFDKTQLKPQSFVRVDGNQFVTEAGKPFVFRGVNIADPDKLVKQEQWNKSLFDEISRNWGSNVIRLPIHPAAWRSRGKAEYLKLIDQSVRWANDLGIYLIVDWHSIGYLPTEQYQHPMYDTTIKETRDFWRTIAFRYKDVPTIAVYELFNEPTTQADTLGARNWDEWKSLNESLIDMIYARDKNVIPLVAGFNWAYDLKYVKSAPINRDGIAYAVHPYPQKAKPVKKVDKEFFRLWEETWGYVAKTYPMIATEIGWVQPDGYGAHIPVKDDGSYGPRIVQFMAERNISWTVWCFDPHWSPTMIEDWSFKPTEQGLFFKKVLLGQ